MQSNFLPGNEWIYYKIYTNYKTQETILSTHIPRLIEHLLSNNIIDKFFFIRYIDVEGEHLRIRFRLIKNEYIHHLNDLLNQNLDYLFSIRLIKKITIDTYKREIGRFAVMNYEYIETLFYYNSLDTISHLNSGMKDFLVITSLIDKIVDPLFLDHKSKYLFFEDFFLSFLSIMQINKIEFIKESAKFVKENQPKFINYIKTKETNSHTFTNIDSHNSILTFLKPTMKQNDFVKLIKDIIHLSINRFVIKNPNQTELLIYLFLSKSYLSLTKTNL